MTDVPNHMDFDADYPVEMGAWVAYCEKHKLLLRTSDIDIAIGMLGIHQRKTECEHDLWVESYSQYIARGERDKFMEELRLKQIQAFKNGKPGTSGGEA